MAAPSTSVPAPSLVRLPVPPLTRLLTVRTPAPFCWTNSSAFDAPTWPPVSVPLFAPTNCKAPLVSVSTLVAAPRLIVCAPAVVSTVRELTERAVTPLLQSNGLAAIPADV